MGESGRRRRVGRIDGSDRDAAGLGLAQAFRVADRQADVEVARGGVGERGARGGGVGRAVAVEIPAPRRHRRVVGAGADEIAGHVDGAGGQREVRHRRRVLGRGAAVATTRQAAGLPATAVSRPIDRMESSQPGSGQVSREPMGVMRADHGPRRAPHAPEPCQSPGGAIRRPPCLQRLMTLELSASVRRASSLCVGTTPVAAASRPDYGSSSVGRNDMVPLSVLDLAPIVEGGDAALAFRRSLDLAQHAERWGYRRFWLAEHHGMPGIASAATAVVIGHVAAGTSTIRVGAGGIMLPNHAPLVIAEQFGTLASLFPGRIDLGLGRAPGSDQLTARALAAQSAGRRVLSPGRRRADGLFPAAASPAARAGRARGGARRADLDSRARACSAPSSRRSWGCRTRSRRTSRRPRCSRRSSCTAPASSRRHGSSGPTS